MGKAGVAGAVGSLTAATPASAQEEVPDDLVRKANNKAEKFNDAKSVQRELRSNAGPLMGSLAREGLIPSEVLSVDHVLSLDEFLKTAEAAFVHGAIKNQKTSAHIEVKRQTDNGKLSILAQPSFGNYYAALHTDREKVQIFEQSGPAEQSAAATAGTTFSTDVTQSACVLSSACIFVPVDPFGDCQLKEVSCCLQEQSCSLLGTVGNCIGCNTTSCATACGYY